MPRKPRKNIFILCRFGIVALLTCWLALPASAGELNKAEARGKQLYLNGTSPSGKSITAQIGAGESLLLPGSSVPCASCHGVDGRGRPEGGIVPGDITLQFLTVPYGHSHENGRKHAAFTTDTIVKAITQGTDPDGNKLDAAMPRYRLSAEDMADLLAYLQRLASDFDPGLTETGISIGTLLPTEQSLAEMGNAMRGVMAAYFDEINAQGGIYGRKIHFAVVEYGGAAAATPENLRQALAPIFALVAAVAGHGEDDLLALTESLGLPQIGPFTLFPQDDVSRTHSTFYLLSGIGSQARARVDYAAEVLNLNNAALAVIGPEGKIFSTAAEAIDVQARKHAFASVSKLVYPQHQFDPQTQFLPAENKCAEAIFYFGSAAELPVLLQECARRKQRPFVFVSGSLAGPELFKAVSDFKAQMFVAYPTLPRSQENIQEFVALQTKYRLPKQHLSAQMMAYSAAKLLIEGLKRSGKALSRNKLIAALENLYQFDDNGGLTPPLTFNSNRHVGAIGAYVMPVNSGGDSAAGRWIEPW